MALRGRKGTKMKSQGEDEFRVRAVTRYVVTHFTSDGHGNGRCTQFGEFPNIEQADAVAKALHETTPESTFATIEDRREPVCVISAFTHEQSVALMKFIDSDAYPSS